MFVHAHQGMSEDINVRIAGQVTSEGLVIGSAFVHCNLLDAFSAHRGIATHQIEEELDLIDRAVETVLQDLKVSAQRIESRRRHRCGREWRGRCGTLPD